MVLYVNDTWPVNKERQLVFQWPEIRMITRWMCDVKASQSTASNASAVLIGHKKSSEYLICVWYSPIDDSTATSGIFK